MQAGLPSSMPPNAPCLPEATPIKKIVYLGSRSGAVRLVSFGRSRTGRGPIRQNGAPTPMATDEMVTVPEAADTDAGGSSSLLGSWWAIILTTLALGLALGWRFLADPS